MQNIKNFFAPSSVALIGATDRENSLGSVVLENLLQGKSQRKIYMVNPAKEEIMGSRCYPDISLVPDSVDLAIVLTPAQTIPLILEQCAKAGVCSVLILTAVYKDDRYEGRSLEHETGQIAKKLGISIIGPNCMGIIKPGTMFNASFTQKSCAPGHVAFLSQSGALGSAILDWAMARGIGFSAFVSLGSMIDIDFGDMIDYFGRDPDTRSIIIYLESLGEMLINAKKFMSAARGFARSKPIIVLKSGKFKESIELIKTHTDFTVGEDSYYNAVFDRAGVVRVEQIEDLFNCASILNTVNLPKGPNMAMITNARGAAVLATDALMERGGKLAKLAEATIEELNNFMPANWSKANPIDLIGDVNPEHYAKALQTTLKDPGVSGLVLIYTPQGLSKPSEIAQAIAESVKQNRPTKPVLAAVMGAAEVADARKLLYESGLPTYDFPEDAIKTYLYMYHYARNLDILYETPQDFPLMLGPAKNYLKLVMRNAIERNICQLNEEDSKKLLITYGIPCTEPNYAKDANEACCIASQLGYPVVMKISSSRIMHKSDIGGVKLNIIGDKELKQAYDQIMKSMASQGLEDQIDGITIQRMVTQPDYELTIGCKKDQVLGPLLTFGLGGRETEFFYDISIGLPPLNQTLARRILERTKIYKAMVNGAKTKKTIDLRLLDEIMVRVSNMVVDFPEIMELNINPLVIKEADIIALDARVILDEKSINSKLEEYSHLIITPYPTRYVQQWICLDGTRVLLRPVRPEDELLEKNLINGLSEESSRYRFFHLLRDITHETLSRFCNIDYEREMAIIAEYQEGDHRQNVGVGRLIMDPMEQNGEFALLIDDNFQGKGLGLKLLDMLIGIAQEKGLKSVYGVVLNDNNKMLNLARKMGFEITSRSEEDCIVTLNISK